MAVLINNVMRRARASRASRRRADVHHSLLRYEARLGGQLFGPIPKGVRREFFCLDEHTWVWHEEWHDAAGKHHVSTIRYDIRPNGIVKSRGVGAYQALGYQETQNLYRAIKLYIQYVGGELQRIAQQG